MVVSATMLVFRLLQTQIVLWHLDLADQDLLLRKITLGLDLVVDADDRHVLVVEVHLELLSAQSPVRIRYRVLCRGVRQVYYVLLGIGPEDALVPDGDLAAGLYIDNSIMGRKYAAGMGVLDGDPGEDHVRVPVEELPHVHVEVERNEGVLNLEVAVVHTMWNSFTMVQVHEALHREFRVHLLVRDVAGQEVAGGHDPEDDQSEETDVVKTRAERIDRSHAGILIMLCGLVHGNKSNIRHVDAYCPYADDVHT